MTYIPQPQIGRGTTLSYTPSGGTLKAFLSLVSVTPPATTVGEVENVLLSSLFKPYLPTIPEAEWSFKVEHWDGDPGCVALYSATQTAPVVSGTFTITLPSGATIAIPGFPKAYKIGEITNEGIIMADVDVRQNAAWTYTPPA